MFTSKKTIEDLTMRIRELEQSVRKFTVLDCPHCGHETIGKQEMTRAVWTGNASSGSMTFPQSTTRCLNCGKLYKYVGNKPLLDEISEG